MDTFNSRMPFIIPVACQACTHNTRGRQGVNWKVKEKKFDQKCLVLGCQEPPTGGTHALLIYDCVQPTSKVTRGGGCLGSRPGACKKTWNPSILATLNKIPLWLIFFCPMPKCKQLPNINNARLDAMTKISIKIVLEPQKEAPFPTPQETFQFRSFAW